MITIHQNAIEAAIASAAGLTAKDEPLLQLARALARQMDEAGPSGPGTRLAGTYLTTVRTLAGRIGSDDPEHGRKSTLSRLRTQHGHFTNMAPQGREAS